MAIKKYKNENFLCIKIVIDCYLVANQEKSIFVKKKGL